MFWMMMLTHIGVTLSLLNPSVLFLGCAVRSISQGSSRKNDHQVCLDVHF